MKKRVRIKLDFTIEADWPGDKGGPLNLPAGLDNAPFSLACVHQLVSGGYLPDTTQVLPGAKREIAGVAILEPKPARPKPALTHTQSVARSRKYAGKATRT